MAEAKRQIEMPALQHIRRDFIERLRLSVPTCAEMLKSGFLPLGRRVACC